MKGHLRFAGALLACMLLAVTVAVSQGASPTTPAATSTPSSGPGPQGAPPSAPAAQGAAPAAAPPAQAQGAPQAPPTLDAVLDRQVGNIERTLVGLAEAMPEDKYNFAPTQGEFQGVRTFAQQIKHVAAANYAMAASILEEKSPAEINNGNGPDNLTTKADIVKYLKDSYAYARRAVKTVNNNNLITPIAGAFGGKTTRLSMATLLVAHGFDHYGQVVVYGRMNGIVPPASQR